MSLDPFRKCAGDGSQTQLRHPGRLPRANCSIAGSMTRTSSSLMLGSSCCESIVRGGDLILISCLSWRFSSIWQVKGYPFQNPFRGWSQRRHRHLAPRACAPSSSFTYAPGKEPTYEGDGAASLTFCTERSQHKIHTATDAFQSSHRRLPLNLEHLVEAPLRACEPFLSHRPEDRC